MLISGEKGKLQGLALILSKLNLGKRVNLGSDFDTFEAKTEKNALCIVIASRSSKRKLQGRKPE